MSVEIKGKEVQLRVTKIFYEKPRVEKMVGVTFTMELMIGKGGQRLICKQCSSCHGCR